MKNDSSRNTFDAGKHYSSVRMQQGRVQLDADWNEQSDIATHRVETEASDIIGLCGGPLHDPAFHIVADVKQLTGEEQKVPGNKTAPKDFKVPFKAPDFLISAGRYYVDGILCENEQLTSYVNQPDLPDAVPIEKDGQYLVYVDVWQRHLTALDDPSIREIALGGPDTATRVKTVWQVKYWFAGAEAKGNCLTEFKEFEKQIAPSNGALSARSQQEKASTTPCVVPPGAGYRGLENQLYRVEIHQRGAALDVTTKGGAGTTATRVPNTSDQIKVSGSWEKGQAVEIFSSKVGSDPLNGTLAYVTKVDTGPTLTLNIDVSRIPIEEMRLRAVEATYKWSRDNGVIVTTIESINSQDSKEITVHDLGPDAVLGFKEGQWVEIIDDGLELIGQPGQLAQIAKIDPAINLITLSVAASLPKGVDKQRHPKLRAWDGIGAVKFHPTASEDHFLDLEDGVQVRFFDGTFKTGDYWTIPARTATADTQSGKIEWPQVSNTNTPLAVPPFGIKHLYCRLAMLYWDGKTKLDVEDCRNLFPPITELTSLLYVSGDGQEAMPKDPLPQLLQVGVFNGDWPVANAHVRFVAQGDGRVASKKEELAASTTNTLIVVTREDGIASCAWRLEPDVTKPSQQTEARLLDADGKETPGVVRFNGNLSIADQVAYDPKKCGSLANQKTVQQAIDRVVALASLYPASETNFTPLPNQAAPFLLRVVASSKCGPVSGMQVTFKVITAGGGQVNPPTPATTDVNGLALCSWTPGAALGTQVVEAELQANPPSHPTVPPTIVRFTAQRAVVDDPGFHVTGLFLRTNTLIKRGALPKQTPLRNNMEVTLPDFAKGLQIEFDAEVDPASIFDAPDAARNKPVCFVTLEIPFLVDQNEDVNAPFVGFQPVILEGRFEFAVGNIALRDEKALEDYRKIVWTASEPVSIWIDRLFASFTRLLARLTLKGNFIWAKDKPDVYLDGEVFGVLSGSPNDLRLPSSGDGKRGGDLEMWFWVIPAPSRLTSLSLDPTTVTGTQGSTGTVGLTGPAPSGGFLVSLSGSDPKVATVPTSVTVAAEKTSATFNISTQSVSSTQKIDVTASQGGTIFMAPLAVEPPKIILLKIEPTIVTATQVSVGTVGLTGPAPSGGFLVSLSGSDPKVATVPASVTVPAGATSATFKIPTQSVSSTQKVEVTASQGGTVLSASLTVTIEPPHLTSLKLEPTVVTGSQGSIGAVGLTGPAPSGGFVVALSSSNPKVASVPATVTVAAAATSATFKIATIATSLKSVIVITASQGPNVVTAGLTLVAPIQ